MEIAADKGKAIPLTVLTGFLGAGKTTLLNRILNGDHGLKVAVLVNDFGSINIDAELVVGVEDDTINLSNGCVCCQIRDDLMEAVDGLLERDDPIEYILLEASGVADPAGIAVTFNDPNYRNRIRLDSITCVVDADQITAHPDDQRLIMLKMRQIALSDMVILNKVDLAGPEMVAEIKAWIDQHIKRIRFVECSYCDAPLEILLSVGRFDPARQVLDHHDDHKDDHHHGHDHVIKAGEAFSTWSYESDKQFSLDAVKEMARKLPEEIYRCKGFVYTSDAPEKRAVLQVVGRRADVSLLDDWNGKTPRTRIVAIASHGSIDARDLKQRFDDCISDKQNMDKSYF